MSNFVGKVRRILSELALEETRSVADYSDGRLAGILNAESAARIAGDILADGKLLSETARRSYTHSNGFDKITLIASRDPEFKLRLHIWWPRGQDDQGTELIHNHRWLFRSTTLCGNAFVEIFRPADSGTLMYRHEYFPRDDALERYELKAVGRARLASEPRFMLAPGSTYSMNPDSFQSFSASG